jgi:4-amino-4-deoxy-L-arabinose transferase-like glycosyltransferase
MAVMVIAILPSLIQDGMFIDGVQYATVSKNWANGLGTFWFPHITQNWNVMGSNVFLENPPLVYAIQGMFFRIFGDGMYTERIYGLFTALVAIFLLAGIWKLVTGHHDELRKLNWLPVLVWLSMPIVFRSYQMNVQENTMGIFTLASVYVILNGLEKERHTYLYILLGGVFIFLATLCKGLTGLFPVVAVAMYWVSGGNIRFPRALFLSLNLVGVPVLLYGLVLLNPDARESLSFYWESRLVERIYNDPVVGSHFHVFFRLLLDLIPVILVSSLVFFFRRKKVAFNGHAEGKRHILFFLLMGLSGSAPLALTLVQRDFYLGPSLPFFALAFSLFLSVYLTDMLKEFTRRTRSFLVFRMLGISLLIGGLVYTGMMFGKAGRDQDILHDTYLFGEVIEEGNRVRLEAYYEDPLSHWNLELYLARYFNISLGAPLRKTEYLILDDQVPPPDRQVFEPLPLDTRTYHLYRRKQ